MKFYYRFLLIALSVFLVYLSFPTPSIGWLAWVALVPAFIAFNGLGFKKGFLWGELFGFGLIASVVSWFGIFGAPALVVGSIYFGLFFAVYFGIYGYYAKRRPGGASHWSRLLLPPLMWMAMEWLKSQWILGFTWGCLGFSQYNFKPILQTASIAGVYGISFLIVFFNNLLAETVLAFLDYCRDTGLKPWKAFPSAPFWSGMAGIFKELTRAGGESPSLRNGWVASACLFPAILIWGVMSVPLQVKMGEYEELNISGNSLRVGTVQVNMPQDIKWKRENLGPTLDILKEKTKTLAEHGVKLVIWPETAIPHRNPLADGYLRQFILDNARNNQVNLLTGLIDRDSKGHYNSVILVNPEGKIAGKYNKIHLVPMGEYFPFPKKYRKYKIFDRIGDYSHGKEMVVFDLPQGKFSVLICFESMFPILARRAVGKGAQFLVVMTNDAWFLKSNAAKTHFIMAQFRAVEQRRWVVQCGNTGISGLIDPWGNILEETEIFTRVTTEGSLYPMNIRTLYNYWGDAPSILAAVLTLVILFIIPRFDPFKKNKQGVEENRSGEEKNKQASAGEEADNIGEEN